MSPQEVFWMNLFIATVPLLGLFVLLWYWSTKDRMYLEEQNEKLRSIILIERTVIVNLKKEMEQMADDVRGKHHS